jgi:hypothetical protein
LLLFFLLAARALDLFEAGVEGGGDLGLGDDEMLVGGVGAVTHDGVLSVG